MRFEREYQLDFIFLYHISGSTKSFCWTDSFLNTGVNYFDILASHFFTTRFKAVLYTYVTKDSKKSSCHKNQKSNSKKNHNLLFTNLTRRRTRTAAQLHLFTKRYVFDWADKIILQTTRKIFRKAFYLIKSEH